MDPYGVLQTEKIIYLVKVVSGESSHLLVVPNVNCWLRGLVISLWGGCLSLLGSVAK